MNLKPILSFVASRPKWQIVAVAASITLGALAGAIHEHDARIAAQATLTYRLAAAVARTAHTDTIRLAADTVVRHDSVRVTREIHLTDTLWATIPDTLRTHADTVRVLDALPTIRQQSDSVTRACRDFVTSCAAYRTAAESTMAALRDQIALATQLTRTAKQRRAGFRTGLLLGIAGALVTARYVHH